MSDPTDIDRPPINKSDSQAPTSGGAGIRVSAPSRLHFGLFSIGSAEANRPPARPPSVDLDSAPPRRLASAGAKRLRFGGVGLMIDAPRTELELTPSDRLEIRGEAGERILAATRRWFDAFGSRLFADLTSPQQLPVRIDVRSLVTQHVGLGSGTQTALALAQGLFRFFDHPTPPIDRLALGMGRGRRSAIGSHGHFRGGLLIDRGIDSNEALSPLDLHLDFPDPWSILLVIPDAIRGLSGPPERRAFEQLPPTPIDVERAMLRCVADELVPALCERNYERFADAIYRFGLMSGGHFASVQQGPFNGPLLTELVQSIRAAGIAAVGQSSWGPCIFAIAEDDEQIESLLAQTESPWNALLGPGNYSIQKTHADNSGASIEPLQPREP